jgi:hypothetical protein
MRVMHEFGISFDLVCCAEFPFKGNKERPMARIGCLSLNNERMGKFRYKQPVRTIGRSLLPSKENSAQHNYQVKGDAELMHHTHVEGVSLQAFWSFKTAYTLATITQEQAEWIAYYANQEDPPSAPDAGSVKERCRGWTVRGFRRRGGDSDVVEGVDVGPS